MHRFLAFVLSRSFYISHVTAREVIMCRIMTSTGRKRDVILIFTLEVSSYGTDSHYLSYGH